MTFGAVLSEEYGTGRNGVRIVLERIRAVPGLFGGLLQFRVDCWIGFGCSADRGFLAILALRKHKRRRKK
jgi:hypothetical protein